MHFNNFNQINNNDQNRNGYIINTVNDSSETDINSTNNFKVSSNDNNSNNIINSTTTNNSNINNNITNSNGVASKTSAFNDLFGSKTNKLRSFIKKEFTELENAFESKTDSNEDYHNADSSKSNNDKQSVVIERQGGLRNKFVLVLLILWYMFSALTLYTNKYVVTTRKADPTMIGILFLNNLVKNSTIFKLRRM